MASFGRYSGNINPHSEMMYYDGLIEKQFYIRSIRDIMYRISWTKSITTNK